MRLRVKVLSNTSDMSEAYAVFLPNGKVQHFTYPLINSLISSAQGEDNTAHKLKLLDRAVKKYMDREDVELSFLPAETLLSDTTKELIKDSVIAMLDPQIRRDYLRQSHLNCLVQYQEKVRFSGMLSFLRPIINSELFEKIDKWLFNLAFINAEDSFDEIQVRSSFVKSVWTSFVYVMEGLKRLSEKQTVRKLASTKHLTVGFAEEDMAAAIEAIANDLNIIGRKFNIRGNLVRPVGYIQLGDIAGRIGKVYAIYCGVVFNEFDTLKTGDSLANVLSEIGVKCITQEGGLTWLNGVNPNDSVQSAGPDIELIRNNFQAKAGDVPSAQVISSEDFDPNEAM